MSEQTTEGTESAPETTGAGLDLSPVLQRFDDLGSRTERMEQQLSEFMSGQQPEEESGEEFDFTSLFGEPEEPEVGQQQYPQVNAEAMQQLIDQRAEALMEQRFGPLMERVQGIEVSLDAEALAARYPELGNRETAEPVVQAAQQLAEELGNPQLVNNMKFVEAIYKAQKADRLAADEKPAGSDNGFELERGGGAGPAAADEPNIAQRVIAQQRAQSPWRSW